MQQSLVEWERDIWRLIARAPLDKHSPLRNATFASRGVDGHPQARIVVLREVEPALRRLTFFTDQRTSKVSEVEAFDGVLWMLWHPQHQLQLRLQARAQLETDRKIVDAAWARIGSGPAAGDYLSARAPGSALDDAELAPLAEPQLCIVRSTVSVIDALELRREGHRRARFEYAETQLTQAYFTQS